MEKKIFKKTKWKRVGYCDVDAGIIHIGDPCYILPRKVDKDSGLDYDEYLSHLEREPSYKQLPFPKDPKKLDAETLSKWWTDNTAYERQQYREWASKSGVDKIPHEAGHHGRGICISNFGGDGTYPVYIERDEKGMVVAAKIKFN